MATDIADRFPAVVARLTGGEYKKAGGGITFRCPCAERHWHGDRNPSCRLFVGRAGALMGKCLGCGAGFLELSRVAGLPASDWFPEHLRTSRRGATRMRVVARYAYRNADGSLYGTKTRFEPKSFGWSRPCPDDIRQLCGIRPQWGAVVEGSGAMDAGWYVNRLGNDGVYRFRAGNEDDAGSVLIPAAGPCPLYRLGDVLRADPGRGVVIVEGEGKADLVASLGFLAVSGPHGANVWPPEYSAVLSGRRVLLVPDNNPVGLAYMERVAGSLMRFASEIRTLEPSQEGYDLAPEQDVADYIRRERRAGNPHLNDTLRALFGRVPRWVRA